MLPPDSLAATSQLGVTPESTFIAALGVLAATASTVSVSVSRQENLSSRTRTLAREFRDLDKCSDKSDMEKQRLLDLPNQIFAFERRLRHCVQGHLLLYAALTVEVMGFGLIFVLLFARSLLNFLPNPQMREFLMLAAYGLVVIALFLVVGGLFKHIAEYRHSMKTMRLELKDIRECVKKIREVRATPQGPEHKAEVSVNPVISSPASAKPEMVAKPGGAANGSITPDSSSPTQSQSDSTH
jgi:amino acid transporter